MQVADRFHLLKNLAEALELVFSAHGQELEAFNEAQRREPVPQKDSSVVVPVPPPPRASTAQKLAEQRRARQVGIGKSTVLRYLAFQEQPRKYRICSIFSPMYRGSLQATVLGYNITTSHAQ